jgi:Family of unknown function (DUF6155)
MPKPKLSDFKKLLAEMTEEEVRAELLKLFNKLEQVQLFYAQDLMGKEDRQKILEECKTKIYKKFWTPSGNPRNNVSNADIRKIITDFEKISAFPHEVVELILYRVDTATDFAHQFGGMADGDYNASSTAYEKAMKLISKNKLETYFKEKAQDILQYDNLDYWYINQMEDMFEECFSERPKRNLVKKRRG